MIDAPDFGERVRRLRVARGQSQTDLAEQLPISAATLSLLENGRTQADDELVERLAVSLRCRPEYLHRTSSSVVGRPWLRAYADAPKRVVDQHVAEVEVAVEAIEVMKLRHLPDIIPSYAGDPADDEAIEEFAADVRAAAGLEEGAVVRNMMRATEKLGCLLLPMKEELGRHLGMSTQAGPYPLIRVSRPAAGALNPVPGDRQRFTVAHELGHLALHRDVPPPKDTNKARRIEREANIFAGAFLAPGDALIDDLSAAGGRVTLSTLQQLKSTWGVAVKALVARFGQLNVIDEGHARSLYKQISARGWNKGEPIHVGNERAVWFGKALEHAAAGADATTAAAEATGLAPEYFDRWIDWSPVGEEPNAQVIGFRPKPHRTVEPGGEGSGQVTALMPHGRG